jgi:hypothetical protein
MSRIDDAADERRAEEARLAERRNKERLQKQRTSEASAFDRALAQRASEQGASKAFKESLEKPKGPPVKDARAAGKPGERADEALLQDSATTERTVAERQADRRMPQPRTADASAQKAPPSSQKSETRAAKESREAHVSETGPDSKGEDIGREVAGLGQGKKGGPVKRAGDDSGGSGGQEGGSGGSKKDEKPAAFRLPPAALMVPPPLARPKDAGGSRLSSVKEIVDKIVSRVLVGTNREGKAEFRIDLKGSVLKGLSIKVTGGRGGKIRAVFSGSDREVLAALKNSSSDLVDALAARGLTLEDLQFEETEASR